ncbi:ABC transporter substrate-binding protein [Natrialba aegyptia]|uniref:Ferrichrome-binding protein n=1 Tax=Natrialba aegyptia DSM 13077 TaxID=1227491 RepID=M0AK35_9EURY|nr:ABC transporter substrate-binding protein [Natrialba aegyptia]ELY98731.1 ferrichrome-binding protein [Natrialba aegyptia DSM 13077]
MPDTTSDTAAAPTRRDTLKHGGVLATAVSVAGCSDLLSHDADTGSEGGSDDSAYEACLEPVGCLTFEEIPETYIVNNGEWADMAFALGQRDGFQTAANMIPGFLFEPFGLDVPPESETASLSPSNWDKERFYELDPDVILMDPNYMHETGWDSSWDERDTAEIRDTVAPFFGKNILRRREWHNYRSYSLYEAFERLADLFQERDRYEAFADIHERVLSEIDSRLPPQNERPDIALINSASDPTQGQFYPMDTRVEGLEMKPYRDLDVGSAFSPDHVEAGTIDYERLLEVDPDIIVVHWGIGTTDGGNGFSAAAFRDQYVTPLEDHPVGSQLTAVQNGSVYPGAFGSQGPIVNLLQTEMVARQFYPEIFGEFDPEAFPEFSTDELLFDRQRVADIINGEF